MSLRRKFVLVFVAFAVTLTAAGGWAAWRITSIALEEELDRRLRQVAGAAVEVGFESSGLLALNPGDEYLRSWSSAHERLARMRRYVSEAWIFDRNLEAIVTSMPADSIPIGTPLRWLDAYEPELGEAWYSGESTTPIFRGQDGRLYQYGFVRIEDGPMLAVLMPTDYLAPLDRLRRTLLFGGLGAVLLAASIAAFLATTVVVPLERLARVAIRIQRGRVDEPVAVERGDELGRLSRAMERMRQGIVQRDEQLRLMVAQVAHEIRNPLGGVELFASAADVDDPAERKRLLGKIRSEVRALNQIINDFLVFAKPLEPGTELEDLRPVIREAVDLVEAESGGNGTTVEVDLPADPLLAFADSGHVKRIMLNLLRNAAQAGSRIKLSGAYLRGEVVLTVRDDGPGVPEKDRERIFEPFVTDKEQGAGLGLTIVRRLTETNGGRVELEADGGEGATFHVYLKGPEELPAPETEKDE